MVKLSHKLQKLSHVTSAFTVSATLKNNTCILKSTVCLGERAPFHIRTNHTCNDVNAKSKTVTRRGGSQDLKMSWTPSFSLLSTTTA